MSIVTVNVTRMFDGIEPWDCSNSIGNLGPNAADLTWRSANTVANDYAAWLETPVDDACEAVREWARSTGAWSDADEVESWSTIECMAMLVQIIAGEMRNCLDADNNQGELDRCVTRYEATDWNSECEFPTAVYYVDNAGHVKADWTAQ